MPDRILIIEDDADVAMFEKMILERSGYEVRIVNTGSAGLEAEPVFKPAVVLLDPKVYPPSEEQRPHVTALDDASGIHHRDPGRDLGNQLQRGLRADGVDLAQVGAAGEPV